MGLITDVLIQMGVYTAIFLGVLFILNFLMKGVVFAYMRVRAQRGKEILVNAFTVTDAYWARGHWDKSALIYKNREGDDCRIVNAKKSAMYSMWGVFVIQVDEEKNCVIAKDGKYETVNTFAEVDDHVERALNAPQIMDKKDVALIVLVLVLICMVGWDIYVAYQTKTAVMSVLSHAVGVIQ